MHKLLSRLKLAHKYTIVGMLVFIVTLVPTSMVVFDKAVIARQSSAAAEYMGPARQTLEVIRLTQQARGLSSAFVNGNTGIANNLNTVLNAAQQAHELAAAQMRAAGVDVQTLNTLQSIRADLRELGSRVLAQNINSNESFNGYTAVVARQLAVLSEIISATGLDLDSSPDTYALITGLFGNLPQLTEYLGQTRALGSGMLARGTRSDADLLNITVTHALATDRLQAWNVSLDAAQQHSTLAESSLSGITQRTDGHSRSALALTQRELINAQPLSYSSSDHLNTMTQAIDSQFELASQASTVLGTLLDTRAGHAQQQLWLLLSGLSVLAIAAFVLAISITRNVIASLQTSLNMARTVAKGDLTSVADINGTDEVQQLLQALNDMNGNLVHIVSQVRNSTNSIATAAGEIAAGNRDLSGRTISQAAALEETAASMEQITSTVTQNSDNAGAANTLTRDATEIARRSGEAVQQFVETMSAIRETSSRISDIVGIIDGIAFQTNILALNAAVEAARAGEAGKGFAVVASEVRSLAQRSATSAHEIRDLIGQSAAEVDAGSKLADAAGETMRQVLDSIEQVRQLVNDIAVAGTEQSAGIAQVNIAVGQMDGVTQQNAALVQEASAAAESMLEQAEMLVAAVSTFQLPGAPSRYNALGSSATSASTV